MNEPSRIEPAQFPAHREIVRTLFREYATSLEMAGASISLLALNDERLALLNAPASG